MISTCMLCYCLYCVMTRIVFHRCINCFPTDVFQNSSVPRLTCTPSQVGGALDTVRWYHRTSSDDVQGTLIVKDGSRYGGDALDTLSINNVVPGDEGLYRCEYTLRGGTQGQDDDVGCVLVQGQSVFIARFADSMYFLNIA